MFDLDGAPSVSGAADVLVLLLLLAYLALLLRRPAPAGRASADGDRTRSRSLAVGMLVGWAAFVLVVTVVGVALLLPLLLAR